MSSASPIILGIDPGYHRCGYALLQQGPRGQLQVLECGVLGTEPGREHAQRLHELGQDMAGLLTQWQPQLAVVEKLFAGRNTTTVIPVAEARGVLLAQLAAHGTAIHELTPQQVKKAATGNGAADKHQVRAATAMLLGLPGPVSPDDAADALALALAGYHHTPAAKRQ